MRETACPYGAAYGGALGKREALYVVGDGSLIINNNARPLIIINYEGNGSYRAAYGGALGKRKALYVVGAGSLIINNNARPLIIINYEGNGLSL